MFNRDREYAYQRSGSAAQDGHVVEAVAAQSEDIRAKFVSVVYGLLTVSILFAIGGAVLSATTGVKVWVGQNILIMLILYIGTIIGAYVLRKRRPLNLVMLYGFTFVSGLFIGPVAYVYPGATLNAGITTAVIFLGLTVYARTTRRDLTHIGGMLTMGLIAIIVMMLLNMFFFNSSALQFGISVAGVLLFSGFILYDTQMIMKRYPMDEYMAATLSLYLDILNLFWFLLQIFLAFGGDD